MFAFDVEELTTSKNDVLSGVIVLLIGYGPAAASFTYCTSFLFSSPAFCSVFNIVFGFLIGEHGENVLFFLRTDDPKIFSYAFQRRLFALQALGGL